MVKQRPKTCWLTSCQWLIRLTKAQGNYNNEVVFPYNVLHMPDDTEKLVLEMGRITWGYSSLSTMLNKSRHSDFNW